MRITSIYLFIIIIVAVKNNNNNNKLCRKRVFKNVCIYTQKREEKENGTFI